ncbi:hypothetical protein [Fredinandcohnia quinoae]|uniref:Uncharacterized protein n=1 Tax=Fredinandcohnia quinoae TaxID=2918902 RepID=A0AAW5DUI1_9BACI|nr:hypothetical protein [Fredinandcohnia sp. SECRCQ15]MCH1624286.1 hypothetical protein [Fredinandcohnia sp. SECRCQ15]
MKKAFYLLSFSLCLVLISGCGNNERGSTKEGPANSTFIMEAETTEGDFVYRLVSEKELYKEAEPVKLYAELEYIGDQDSISIFHAGSPFYFDMTEKTRDYEIPYPMIQPLIQTTLKKGEPLREPYTKSGGYSDQDDGEYVKFMKKFLKGDDFPTGQYEVKGNASFHTEEYGTEQQFNIEAKIEFEVK